jgi:hypothetical protein
MKTSIPTLALLVLAPAAILVFTSCSSTPEGEATSTVETETGVPGGVWVDTYQETATVTAVDPATRKVTLVTPAGKKTVFKAGPQVVNFPQIRVGDQVKATLAEELVVFMATDAPPQSQEAATVVKLAPVGAKPGALVADTVQVKAKVTAIDHKKHKATLRFPDGSSKTISVRKDVDLTRRSVGEEVVIRSTEVMAITVEKP